MTDFPDSAQKTKDLAVRLVRHLKNGVKNTHGSPTVWKNRNFTLLAEFCRTECNEIDPIYTGNETGPECLWDFVGYIKGKGILITAESEFNTDHDEMAKDFDKLLYGSSPIKLMICRIDTRYSTQPDAAQEADRIREHLESQIKRDCTSYPAGSVFIVYCVWWAEEGGPNRDFPYILQIDGEPHYISVRSDQQFELAGNPGR